MVTFDELSLDSRWDLDRCNHVVSYIDHDSLIELEVGAGIGSFRVAVNTAIQRGYYSGIAEINSYYLGNIFATTSLEKLGISGGETYWDTCIEFG